MICRRAAAGAAVAAAAGVTLSIHPQMGLAMAAKNCGLWFL